jgi:MoxR-like ATPase
LIAQTPCALTPTELTRLQHLVRQVHVSDAFLDYLQSLVEETRRTPRLQSGLSPRAGLALLHSAQAWALTENRDHVRPEDLQAVFPAVAVHRLQGAGEFGAQTAVALAQDLLELVPIP